MLPFPSQKLAGFYIILPTGSDKCQHVMKSIECAASTPLPRQQDVLAVLICKAREHCEHIGPGWLNALRTSDGLTLKFAV